MALHNRLLQIMLLWEMAASQVIRPGCEEKCGNVSIPYPFGTRVGCYLNQDFLITCNKTFSPPKPFLWTSNIELLNISLDGELRILLFIGSDCYNQRGDTTTGFHASTDLRTFPMSTTRNKFTAVGCDTSAKIEGSNVTTGCMSVCNSTSSITNGSCSGIGCCQTSIPKNLLYYNVTINSFYNHTRIFSFNPCSYAFLVEEASFNFTLADLSNLNDSSKLPSVLDWAIGNQTCEEARKNSTSYACQAHSYCYNSDNGPGYRCNCSHGYKGNPYLPHSCQGYASSIPWKTRLRIAIETAGALSYLHSAASTPIIHRDVKTANILLDDNYTAKVSDFGASRLVPIDKAQLTTLVRGTLGYLDPEYFLTSQLTERSDVYSFGVVLVELLTGKMALSFERLEDERNLAMYFISSVKNDRLFEILDNRVLNEGNAEQLKEVAMIAKRCLAVKGEERPTMKEVAMELEGLRAILEKQLQGEIISEKTELLLCEPSDNYGGGTSSNTAGITKQVTLAFGGGR